MWADHLREVDLLGHVLSDSRKIAIHPDVLSLALQLAQEGEEKIRKVSPYAVWPDYDTWIEGILQTENGALKFGFFFHGWGLTGRSVEEGLGFLAFSTRPEQFDMLPVRYDLPGYALEVDDAARLVEKQMKRLPAQHPLRKEIEEKMVGRAPYDLLGESLKSADIREFFKPLLVAVLALMNSPKLVRTREHDMEKFNKRRLKRGKYPYFPHHEITLNIDKTTINVTRGQDDGPERCLHFVRAHPRFYVHPRYKAQVTIVQPHWRGNPELGIKDPHYNVGREGSQWPDKQTH